MWKIETRGAFNTVVWVLVGLAIFAWVLTPLKDKVMANVGKKEETKKA